MEQALIDNLQDFLLELEAGFAFVDRQHRILIEDDQFFADLVFYHIKLKCYVLIDLKTTKLTHQDTGQINMYVRYFDDVKKENGDNPTIGLILCAVKNNTMTRCSLLHDYMQIFASKYKVYLPSEEKLLREIGRGRHQAEIERTLSVEE